MTRFRADDLVQLYLRDILASVSRRSSVIQQGYCHGSPFSDDGVHIFLVSESGKLHVAYSRLTERAARLRRWLEDEGGEFLRTRTAFTLYECEPDETRQSESEPAEHLVVPVTSADGARIGAIGLGPKRSEQPFTTRDRDLLRGVAGQVAVVHDVLRLKERYDDERRVRMHVLSRLDREHVQMLSECPECGRCYTTADQRCTNDGASLSLTLPVERTIDGKYRLDRRIGSGGMGVVYEGTDERLSRAVAIKIMTGESFGNNVATARFEREARAAALLNHRNIVTVYDFSRLATGGA